MALDTLALVPITEENDGAFSEAIGYKLWNKFVDWAHCHDLPLVVDAYAIRQKYTSVTYKNGKAVVRKSSVLVFMMGDKERCVCTDRVSNDARMLRMTKKIRRFSQELLEGQVAPLPFPRDLEGRLIPEDWFVERDTGTRPTEVGDRKVLIMPPASEEKKQRWEEEETEDNSLADEEDDEEDHEEEQSLSQ